MNNYRFAWLLVATVLLMIFLQPAQAEPYLAVQKGCLLYTSPSPRDED